MKSRDEIEANAKRFIEGKPLTADEHALALVLYRAGYEQGAKDEWNAAIEAAGKVADDAAVSLALAAARAEQAGREGVAYHRYSDSEAINSVMAEILALAKKEGEK
jgi:hypothetical protein